MKILFRRFAAHGVGTRPFTEDDFYRLCEASGIRVIWSNEKYAFHFNVQGHLFIVLPKRLRGIKLLFVALHEWAHIVHPGGTTLCQNKRTKDEVEADAVALVAMMPRGELLDDTPLAYQLRNDREVLRFYYEI